MDIAKIGEYAFPSIADLMFSVNDIRIVRYVKAIKFESMDSDYRLVVVDFEWKVRIKHSICMIRKKLAVERQQNS